MKCSAFFGYAKSHASCGGVMSVPSSALKAAPFWTYNCKTLSVGNDFPAKCLFTLEYPTKRTLGAEGILNMEN